jgi:tripartite-type tricarboxylate transporter receptor subunit TctC
MPLAPIPSRAQAYPARPVRVVVGYPAGGVADIYARLVSQWLTDHLGQSFIIENRPGASGTIAVEAVSRAQPDGYTLLLSAVNDVYNEFIYPNLTFNYSRDIAPIAEIAVSACIMLVRPSFPAVSISEFIAYAKANPGKVNYASSGIGSTQHVAGELFKILAGIDMVHVPYRGGAPALADLLAGQVQIMFEFMTTSLPHVRSGALRALGVTSATRSPTLPDVPSIGEFLPSFEATAWFGIAAPRQTPPDVIDRINREINSALADPRIRAKIAELGGQVIPVSSTDFVALIAADREKWGKVIRDVGIKAE